jgi:hypothetical protein
VLYSSLTIFNKDDVVDDLGEGVADEVYRCYFDSLFSIAIKNYSNFKRVYTIYSMNNKYQNRELPLDEMEEIRIQLPIDGTLIQDSLNVDYVLFISNYAIQRLAGSPGTWSPAAPGQAPMMTGGSFGSLSQQLEFALWDNLQGKIISYGRAEVKSTIVFAMTKSNWTDCIYKIARYIMKASPFYVWSKRGY